MKKLTKEFNSFAGTFMQKKRLELEISIKEVAQKLNLSISTYSDKEAGVGISTLILIQFSQEILNKPTEVFFKEIEIEWNTKVSEKGKRTTRKLHKN